MLRCLLQRHTRSKETCFHTSYRVAKRCVRLWYMGENQQCLFQQP